MSSVFILPTCDLVTECQTYDNLFHLFIPGGVRSVIKDAVLLTSYKEPTPELELHQHLRHPHSDLVDYVLRRFDNYTSRRDLQLYEEHGGDAKRQFDLGEYLNRVAELEMVSKLIEEAVQLMMLDLFKPLAYHIDDRRTRWIGYDLVIGLETLNGHLRGRRGQ